MKVFKEKLLKYCEGKGISVSQFERSIGLSAGTLNRYFAGTRFPQPEIVERMHTATDKEIEPNDFYKLNYKKK